MTASRRDAGATSVEFALVLPALLVFLLGVLAFGLNGLYGALADSVARKAARFATIRDSTGYPTDTEITQRVTTFEAVILPPSTGGPSITRSAAGPSGRRAQGDLVTVEVTYVLPVVGRLVDAADAIPGLDLSGAGDITRAATARLE